MDDIVGLVPAAGEGTRLYPFSKAVPKEMYPILGKAAIEHCIDNLSDSGVKKIFIVVGHQKGALMDYIGDGSHYGVSVAYIYQYERKGLGHAILQGRKWIGGPFFVILGDSFVHPKEEAKRLLNLHREKKPIATLLLFEVDDPDGYGIVKLDESGKVTDLVEKPGKLEAESLRTDGKLLAITGAYVFDSKIFDYIERTPPGAKGEIQITDAIKLAITSGELAYGTALNGRYFDIGKWKTVLSIEKEMVSTSDIDKCIEERESFMRGMKGL